ncbi:MAG: hypothetical protein HYZ25_00235 [Chloroflexi bacterium]|nr:hypothetical protein [Chloroflexota bacterium]
MPDLVEPLFRYFSFLACVLTLLNLWIIRDRVSSAIKVFLASYAVLFLVWGVLQVIGGYRSFFFIILPPKEHPLVMVFWLIEFVWVWGSAIWVLWRGGAEELAKSSAALNPKRARTSQSIKLFFAVSSLLFPILVILGFGTGVFSNFAADLPIF